MAGRPQDEKLRELMMRLDNWGRVMAGSLGNGYVAIVFGYESEEPEPNDPDAELIEQHMLRLKLARRDNYRALFQKHVYQDDLVASAQKLRCKVSTYRRRCSDGYEFLLGSINCSDERRTI